LQHSSLIGRSLGGGLPDKPESRGKETDGRGQEIITDQKARNSVEEGCMTSVTVDELEKSIVHVKLARRLHFLSCAIQRTMKKAAIFQAEQQ